MKINYRFILPVVMLTLLSACKETELTITNVGDEGAGATQSASIAGQVVDSNGVPIGGVVVATQPFGRDFELDEQGRKRYQGVVTDAEGFYEIPNLPQASYRLNFLASGFIKVTISLGPVDFLPENLSEGENGNLVQKSVVLQPYPKDSDLPSVKVALYDPEEKKRMTDMLTTYGIEYDDILGDISKLSKNHYNLLVLGLDVTVFNQVNELIDNKQVLDNFLAEGGSIYLGQHNDFSVENTPMPFFSADQTYILHTEDAPLNDFTSGTIEVPGHPLVQNVMFENWQYVEPGQQTTKTSVTFDAALKSSFNGDNWQIIVTTPATDFTAGNGSVEANSDVIIAEYRDPRSDARIVLNQAAYYQATFGDLTDINGVKLTANVVDYLKWLNRR